jgi:hypothetical protein
MMRAIAKGDSSGKVPNLQGFCGFSAGLSIA